MKSHAVLLGTLCLFLAGGCGMDLKPLGLIAPATATIGDDITSLVSLHVYNVGGETVEADSCTGIFWIYFMISDDEEIGFEDFILNSVDFVDFPLAGREAKPVLFDDESENLEILAGTPVGQGYLGVYVDAHGYCMELDEQNNADSLPIEILPAQ